MCIVTCDYWLSQAHSWLTPHSCTVLGWRRGVEWLCLFNFYTEYIMWHAGLGESQTGIKIARRNINSLRYVDDTTLMAESKEELKSLLRRMKEESEKASLKLNIFLKKTQILRFMANRRGENGSSDRFSFLGSKITADGDCSHEIRRHLLLGRKTMTDLDCVLKSRSITLPTNTHIVKAMVFLVVMYGFESWTIKKAEC